MDDIFYEKTGIIYKITNLVNGKSYVGKSKLSFNKRYSSGKWWKWTHVPELKEDYSIHGLANFTFELLEYDKNGKELLELESFYMTSYNCMTPNGYNKILETKEKREFSEETRLKMSEAGKERAKNFPTPWKGCHHTEETKRRIAITSTGRKIDRSKNAARGPNHPRWGKKQSEEEKNKKRKPNVKNFSPVVQIDPITNHIIREFSSVKEAEQTLGINNVSCVCCKKRRLAGNFSWRYKEDADKIVDSIKTRKDCKTIIQIDKNTNSVLKKFSSVSEAAFEVNGWAANISKACRDTSRSSYGYKWKYL